MLKASPPGRLAVQVRRRGHQDFSSAAYPAFAIRRRNRLASQGPGYTISHFQRLPLLPNRAPAPPSAARYHSPVAQSRHSCALSIVRLAHADHAILLPVSPGGAGSWHPCGPLVGWGPLMSTTWPGVPAWGQRSSRWRCRSGSKGSEVLRLFPALLRSHPAAWAGRGSYFPPENSTVSRGQRRGSSAVQSRQSVFHLAPPYSSFAAADHMAGNIHRHGADPPHG